MPLSTGLGPVSISQQTVKLWALKDDPEVHRLRDITYQIFMDGHAWQGHIPNGEKVVALTPAQHKRLFAEHQRIMANIREKYQIDKLSFGDPFHVRKVNWMDHLKVEFPDPMIHETNYRRPDDIKRLRFLRIPEGARKLSRSKKERMFSLPSLQPQPIDEPPLLSFQVDLSRINQHDLERLAREFKRLTKIHLKRLPSGLKKPPSLLAENLERDYARYHQHFRNGKTYRQIALMERTRHDSETTRVFGLKLRESSIRYSIEQMHLAIRGTLYRARGNRQALVDRRLTHKISTYQCPDHGDACTDSCQYANKFKAILDSQTYQF